MQMQAVISDSGKCEYLPDSSFFKSTPLVWDQHFCSRDVMQFEGRSLRRMTVQLTLDWVVDPSADSMFDLSLDPTFDLFSDPISGLPLG